VLVIFRPLRKFFSCGFLVVAQHCYNGGNICIVSKNYFSHSFAAFFKLCLPPPQLRVLRKVKNGTECRCTELISSTSISALSVSLLRDFGALCRA